MALDAGGVGFSSGSSGSTKRQEYDVFLSFRGEDTRTGFTDHLYDALIRKGLRTFRDEEGLQRGQYINPSLPQAIEQSRSAIVVLSSGYASSTWCLDELQKILYSKKELGLQVFPIFYGIDPSDVRKQKGSFAESFKKHEERFTQDKMKVQRWRDALEEVGKISGWDSQNKHETKFIESIAKEMMSKLLDELPSDLGVLVGIESKLDELELEVASDSEGVRSIGIWGTGGLGKTTLARAFFERNCKEFEACCFLHNITKEYEESGVISLQRKLLSSLNKSSLKVDGYYEGMKLIKTMLSNRKILLVLDDVSDISQLEYLAPEEGWFGNGSRIIITTRDMHLLSSYGVFAQYNIKFLCYHQSLQLFCQYAFKGKNQPNEDYLKLSKSVIEYAGGVPLALKVLGSFLCGRTIIEWKDALSKFKKVPPEVMLKMHKVTFDGLDVKEKTIFLDIACFFNGMAKEHVVQILEILDKDLHPRIGIDILIEKSLVVNYDGRLWVLDFIQGMGRYMVLQESPDDVSKRSRIFSLEDANDVLERNEGTEAIRGMVLTLEESSNVYWDPKAFSKMRNLKLLIISSHSNVSRCQLNLPRGLECLSNALKVVEWEGYPLDSLPSQTQLYELIDLKMRHSMLKELWRGTVQCLRRLKSLNLSHSKCLIKTPDFDEIPLLEILILEGCSNLVEIHESLGKHKNCVTVDLKDCTKVKILPRKLEMNRLKTFVLSGCSEVRNLPEFGNFMNCLSFLDLAKTAISELPGSVARLPGLKELSLVDCSMLGWSPYQSWSLLSPLGKASEIPRSLSFTNFMLSHYLSSLKELHLIFSGLQDGSLPDDISLLSSLTFLDLSGNNFIDLPYGLIANLSKLKVIDLVECPKLQSLPQLPSNISVIAASGCPSMKHYACPQKLWEFIESFQSQVQSLSEVSLQDFDEECQFVELNVVSAVRTWDSQIPKFFMQPTRVITIPGSEVPSWFDNRNYFYEEEFSDPNVSFRVSIPDCYHSSEWWGITICLVLENNLPRECLPWGRAVSWTCRFPYDKFPNTFCRYGIWSQSNCSHQLCIIYIRCSLVVNQIQMAFFAGDEFKIKKCGWRAVCKEDVRTWRRSRGEGCSSINNYIEIDSHEHNILNEVENNGEPKQDDRFIVKKDKSTSNTEPSLPNKINKIGTNYSRPEERDFNFSRNFDHPNSSLHRPAHHR